MLDPWALVVAGDPVGRGTTAVEVISLDPVHHPVPACLKKRAPLPAKIVSGSGGLLPGGKF